MYVKSFIFDKIKSNEKKVEVRVASKPFLNISIGDIIKFDCGYKTTCRRVRSKKYYDTFHQLLEEEGMNNCLPGATNLNEAVEYYKNIPFYAKMETQYGTLAFGLQSQVRTLNICILITIDKILNTTLNSYSQLNDTNETGSVVAPMTNCDVHDKGKVGHSEKEAKRDLNSTLFDDLDFEIPPTQELMQRAIARRFSLSVLLFLIP